MSVLVGTIRIGGSDKWLDVYASQGGVETNAQFQGALKPVEARALAALMAVAADHVDTLRPSIVLDEAPGDRCGNTKRLDDGTPCPGCRACS